LDEKRVTAQTPDFLFDEIKHRVANDVIKFRIIVQLAEDSDIVDDATVGWPEDRRKIAFGELSLTEIAPNNASEQQIIFDPVPRVDGIEASSDPLFDVRANIYLMSGRRRRAAGKR
jgi:catalase